MKKIILSLIAVFLCGTAAAQELRFAYADADSIMRAMPEYTEVQAQMQMLRSQYEREAQYNEQNFQRQFSEFLEGQQHFPEPILLKRQRDLQESMEKGIAFRRDCDRLLRQAENELLAPLRQRVQQAITLLALNEGYAFVLPVAPLYADPARCEDVTPLVIAHLTK